MTTFDLSVAAVSLRVGGTRKDFPLTGGNRSGGEGRPVEDTDEAGSPPRAQPTEDEVRAQEGLDYDDEHGGGGGGAQTAGPGVPQRKDVSTGSPTGDIPAGLAPVDRGGQVRGGRPLTGQNVREQDSGAWHNSDGLSPQATAVQLRRHLWGSHAYDVPLPKDRDVLDRMHAADHSQRGERGAHEAKDITSAAGGGPGSVIPTGLAPVQRGVGPGAQVRGGRRRKPGEDPDDDHGGIVTAPQRPVLVARQRRSAIPKTRPVNWGEKVAEVALGRQQDPRIAATVDAKNRKVEAWRRTMENVAKAHFDRQRRVVKAKLDSVKGRQWLAAEVKAASDDAAAKGRRLAGRVFDRDTWRKQIADDATGVLHAQYDDFGGDEYARLVGAAGLGGFDVNDPKVQAMIARQVERLGLIEDTTGDDLAGAFADAYDTDPENVDAASDEAVDAADLGLADDVADADASEGLLGRLLGAVDATFDNAAGYRANLIGLVETHSAANAATQAAGGQAYGDNATKSWWTMSDDRVRDSHDDMEGVEVALNDPYIVGPSGSPMMYPGDPDGPPEEVIRCRCFQVVNPAGKGRRFHIKSRVYRRAVQVKTWDEDAHPRDERGRFGTGGGGTFKAEPWQTDIPRLLSPEWSAQRQAARDWSEQHIVQPAGKEPREVGSYVAGSFGINGALRAGDAPAGFYEQVAPVIRGADAAIASSHVDTDTVAYRGQESSALEGKKPGDTFVDKGYVSTSLLQRVTRGYGGHTSQSVEVHIPAGSNVYAPHDRTDHELILPRNGSYRVESIDPPVLKFLGVDQKAVDPQQPLFHEGPAWDVAQQMVTAASKGTPYGTKDPEVHKASTTTDHPRFFYHESKTANRDSIREAGLQANRSLGGKNTRVYLAAEPFKMEARSDTAPSDLYRVDTHGIPLRPDPELPEKWAIGEHDFAPWRVELIGTTHPDGIPQGGDKTGEKSVGLSWTVGRTRQVKNYNPDQERDSHGRFGSGGSDTVAVQKAATAWQRATDTSAELRESAERLLAGAEAASDTDRTAKTILNGVARGERVPASLHRGIAVRSTADEIQRQYTPGAEFHMGLSSFSTRPEEGEKWAGWSAEGLADYADRAYTDSEGRQVAGPGEFGGVHTIRFDLEPGARTLPIRTGNDYLDKEDEHVTAGRFKVVGLTDEGERRADPDAPDVTGINPNVHAWTVRLRQVEAPGEVKSYSPTQERATDGRFGSAAGDHPSKPASGIRTPHQTPAPPVSGNTSGSATATLARTAAAHQQAERNGGHNPQPHDPEPHTPGRQASPAKVNLANLFAHAPHDQLGTEGYCDARELQRIQRLAIGKIKAAPKPTAADIARNRQSVSVSKRPGGELRGNSHDRAARAVKLVKEFGDGTTAHCVYCGRELDKDTVTQDKIWVETQGGRYKYDNLLSACAGCNSCRNDTPIR